MSASIVELIVSAGTIESIQEAIKGQDPDIVYEVLREAQRKIEENLEVNIREKRHMIAMLNLAKLAAMDDLVLHAERRMNAAFYMR